MNFPIDGLHVFLLILLVVLFIDRISLKRHLAAVERMSENYKRRAQAAKPHRAARRKGVFSWH